MAKYQASILPNVPINYGNVVAYVLDGTNNWLTLGPHDSFTFTWNVKVSDKNLPNCKLPRVVQEETVTIKLAVAQYFQQSFIKLLGGIVKGTVDSSGIASAITTGGATQEIAPCRMRFVHENAGGGGVYWDVYNVSYSGSGEFSFQDDDTTDKPQMVSVELTGEVDSDREDGDQLFSMKRFSGVWAQPVAA